MTRSQVRVLPGALLCADEMHTTPPPQVLTAPTTERHIGQNTAADEQEAPMPDNDRLKVPLMLVKPPKPISEMTDAERRAFAAEIFDGLRRAVERRNESDDST